MSDIIAVYKDLLISDEGDIIVKLKDGKQLKIISFLVKKRSSVFKAMLESSMQEATTGVVDLSTQYNLEAFREFMAYIYYNKQYTGSYLPVLFEILSIADYYDVDAYRTYIRDRILALITNVPICLMIASEALKYGTLTNEIYARCLKLLMEAIKPERDECYDIHSGDTKAWCCSDHSTKNKSTSRNSRHSLYTVHGQVPCIDATIRLGHSAHSTGYTERCCIHRTKEATPLDIGELPAFIVDDVESAMMNDAKSAMTDDDEPRVVNKRY